MSSIVNAIIAKALDGLSLRSAATAQNIANANSQGFRPLEVSFEAELQAAAARGEEAVRRVPVEMREAAGVQQGVRIDLELETQSRTALRYGALVDLLARELQLQRTIVRGGR